MKKAPGHSSCISSNATASELLSPKSPFQVVGRPRLRPSNGTRACQNYYFNIDRHVNTLFDEVGSKGLECRYFRGVTSYEVYEF